MDLINGVNGEEMARKEGCGIKSLNDTMHETVWLIDQISTRNIMDIVLHRSMHGACAYAAAGGWGWIEGCTTCALLLGALQVMVLHANAEVLIIECSSG
jgi:hypothetical protein